MLKNRQFIPQAVKLHIMSGAKGDKLEGICQAWRSSARDPKGCSRKAIHYLRLSKRAPQEY
jgi:hypothetical protein